MQCSCPLCTKRLWIRKDRVKPHVRCSYCGHIFQFVSQEDLQSNLDTRTARAELLGWILRNERQRQTKHHSTALAVGLRAE